MICRLLLQLLICKFDEMEIVEILKKDPSVWSSSPDTATSRETDFGMLRRTMGDDPKEVYPLRTVAGSYGQ